MAVVSMKQLLEAGVHFGHQTRRWNPKMAKYIFTERNGIYIIDLQKTVKKLDEAYNFVRDTAAQGGEILFVGTKKQAQESIRDEATRCGMHYVNARWLGGMMTNFKTMRTRIDRLNQLKTMQADGTFDMLPKKEVMKHLGEMEKLEKYLGGVKEMKKLPGALFVVDPRKEHNAIAAMLKQKYPDKDDQWLYDHARLVNAALMAKIHTVEWTPAVIANPVTERAMYANWWGLLGSGPNRDKYQEEARMLQEADLGRTIRFIAEAIGRGDLEQGHAIFLRLRKVLWLALAAQASLRGRGRSSAFMLGLRECWRNSCTSKPVFFRYDSIELRVLQIDQFA